MTDFFDPRSGYCAVLKDRWRARGLSPFSGGFGEGETPLPIPNRAVKPLSADGTWLARARESRTPPVFSHCGDGRPQDGRPRCPARSEHRGRRSSWRADPPTGERHGCDSGRGAAGRPALTGLVSFRACSAAPVAWASPGPSCSSTSQSTRSSSSSSRKERISPAAASARCVSGDVPRENMCSQAKDPRGRKLIEHAYGGP